MSTTATAWMLLAAALLILSFKRPVWAVGLYMQTFFAAPQLWWWGDEIPYMRYALVAGMVLLGAVVWGNANAMEDDGRRFSSVHKFALAMVVNATIVHLVLAVNRTTSIDTYIELVKYVLLTYLLWAAIQRKQDLHVVLLSIAIGAGYIGYEVTINERGNFSGSRLEDVGAPGAVAANSLACVMLTVLPLIGCLFIQRNWRLRAAAILSAPLALNVLLLCNSRGAFLGLIAAGLTFPLVARGPTRKKAVRVLLLGCVALYFLLGDPQILTRFASTFVDAEERDGAAAGRLEYWRAGFAMLSDYPLGAGGGAFKFDLGRIYAKEISGREEDRSLHNGYLTEATDWGVQGLLFKLMFIGAAIAAAYRTTTRCRLDGRLDEAMIGVCLIASAAGFLVHTIFGAFLANEWAYWIVALLVRYSELYRDAEPSVVREVTPAVAFSGTPLRSTA